MYDSGEADGQLYLAMRLVQGETLAERLIEHGLCRRIRRLGLFRSIANALDAAHAVGVVHRDLKPQNILLTETDYPYLADFGVSKGVNGSSLTATGGFVGSFNYAAPEQFLGDQATAATDVYALAVVLFQCLTGMLPCTRDTDGGLLTSYVNEATGPQPLALAVGGDFNAMIARGIANDPKRRYARASDLIAAAEAVVNKLSAEQRQVVPAFSVSPLRSPGSRTPGAAYGALLAGDPVAIWRPRRGARSAKPGTRRLTTARARRPAKARSSARRSRFPSGPRAHAELAMVRSGHATGRWRSWSGSPSR